MKPLQSSEIKVNENYKIEFINGSKLVVKFAGFKGGRYYFINENGQKFSIADNNVQYLRFYQ